MRKGLRNIVCIQEGEKRPEGLLESGFRKGKGENVRRANRARIQKR